MLNGIKKLLRPATSYTSLRFILTSLFVIILSGILIVFVYTWLSSSILEYSLLREENSFISLSTGKLDSYLSNSYYTLQSDLFTLNHPSTDDSSLFDIGVIMHKGIKDTQLNFNNNRFQVLSDYQKNINETTPKYYLNSQNKVIFVTYYSKDGSYEVGAIDINGSIISNLIQSQNFHTYILNDSGDILNSNTKGISSNFIKSLKIKYDSLVQMKIGNIRREAFTYSPIQNLNLGIAALSDPVTVQVVPFTQSFIFYLVLLGVVLFLAMVIVYSILVDIPLTRIITFFDDYNKGKERNIRIYSHDSFGIISENINNLIGKVKNDFQRINQADEIQNDFVLLAGHLLRTPLTSIQAYLDLLKEKNKDQNINETIESMGHTLGKLIQLEENILTMSQENNDIISAKDEIILVKDIINEVYNDMTPVARQKNITLIFDNSNIGQTLIKANRKNIVHAIRNYVDNGVKFTSEGGTVKIYGHTKGNTVTISVSDTGIGLTKEEIGQIFKRFSKISDTMEYNADGFGIGLYVTKIIAQKYNGSVSVDSIKGSGSIFNFSLPEYIES